MPVTAKLSKAFDERLGEQIANELVDWFNAADATYRNDLRELNDANFARFDAKLEQRITELRAEVLAEFRTGLTDLEARLERRIARFHADFIKWSFVFWAGLAWLPAGATSPSATRDPAPQGGVDPTGTPRGRRILHHTDWTPPIPTEYMRGIPMPTASR